MKIGISYLYWHQDPDGFRAFLEKSRIRRWEVVLNRSNQEHIRRLISEFSEIFTLDMSFHAPFSELNIACLTDDVRKDSLKVIKKAIEIASDFSSRIVIHPGHLRPHGFNFPDKAWLKNIESIQMLADFCQDLGLRMMLENMPNYPHTMIKTFQEMEGIILGTDRDIGMVFDIGHAHTAGSLRGFMDNLKKIDHIHLHDNDGKKDTHLALGDGTVPWYTILPKLKACEKDLTYVVEMRNFRDGIKSLEFLSQKGFIKSPKRWLFI